MNHLFQSYLRKYIIVFFDDILIYSRNFEEHLNHLETAFQVVMDDKFTLKIAKCSFAQKHIEYLGHIVAGDGVQPIPDKVQAIQRWPQSRTARALRGFLGLVGFYRRFIRGYATMAAPLSKLLTKAEFVWSPEAGDAFQTLKDAITKSPVLALPNFNKPFMVEIDASSSSMGAVLSQEGHPIAFFSKQFCPKLLRSSTYVRELAVITTAIKKWRQYLLGHHFVILTDHWSLKELMSQVVQTPEQHMYLAHLLGFDYVIQYRAGKTNVVAYVLSRSSRSANASFFILSMPHFVFLEDLCKELQSHDEFVSLREKIRTHPAAYPHHSLTSHFILHQGHIWLHSDCSFIKILLTEFDQSPIGGHMGLQKTLNRVVKNFTWNTMKVDT